MTVIRVTAQTEAAEALVAALQEGLQPARYDRIVEKAAFQSLAELVQASPKKWFGQIQKGWQVTKPEDGSRIIDIPQENKSASGTSVRDITRFVNFGTANNGEGWIVPVKKKILYIPLNPKAAAGWNPSLVLQRVVNGELIRGDYLLVPRVHGIKGRHFIEPQRAKAFERLRDALRQYILRLVRRDHT